MNFNESGMPKRQTLWLVFGGLALLCGEMIVLWWMRSTQGPPIAPNEIWWQGLSNGKLGAIMGTTCGLLGALVGTLGGLGLFRRLVLGLMIAACLGGIVSFTVGIIAYVQNQPYGIWYSLTHTGFLCAILFGALYPVVRHGYRMRELQKMNAMDRM